MFDNFVDGHRENNHNTQFISKYKFPQYSKADKVKIYLKTDTPPQTVEPMSGELREKLNKLTKLLEWNMDVRYLQLASGLAAALKGGNHHGNIHK